MFLQGKVNSACYIAQIVKPALLPFIQQEGDVLFQQDNASSHMAAATRTLCGEQQDMGFVRCWATFRRRNWSSSPSRLADIVSYYKDLRKMDNI